MYKLIIFNWLNLFTYCKKQRKKKLKNIFKVQKIIFFFNFRPVHASNKQMMNALLLITVTLTFIPLLTWSLCYVGDWHTRLGHCKGMFWCFGAAKQTSLFLFCCYYVMHCGSYVWLYALFIVCLRSHFNWSQWC